MGAGDPLPFPPSLLPRLPLKNIAEPSLGLLTFPFCPSKAAGSIYALPVAVFVNLNGKGQFYQYKAHQSRGTAPIASGHLLVC